MDGNGRWARQRALPRHAGHRAGVKAVRRTIEHAVRRGVPYLTLFAFSSENFRRPPDEVGRLMTLFVEAMQREIDELHQNKVCLRFIGRRDQLADTLVQRIEAAESMTAANEGLRLTVAMAYGGRWDVAEAARKLCERAAVGDLDPADVDESLLGSSLCLAGVPDPDLLVRTGGEQRISNFLLWNLAYSELWFSDVLWPDFAESDLDAAIAYFGRRERRYGHTSEQLEASKC